METIVDISDIQDAPRRPNTSYKCNPYGRPKDTIPTIYYGRRGDETVKPMPAPLTLVQLNTLKRIIQKLPSFINDVGLVEMRVSDCRALFGQSDFGYLLSKIFLQARPKKNAKKETIERNLFNFDMELFEVFKTNYGDFL